MNTKTTIKQMLSSGTIYVPDYQRAYSWDVEFDKKNKPLQLNVFISDLEAYKQSRNKSPYYFGHFIFEKKEEGDKYGVIDGQQRITTIIIFLSVLFNKLIKKRGVENLSQLKECEQVIFEDIIKRKSTYRFNTVEYDDQLFKDYIIDRRSEPNINKLETESAKRIVKAYKFFTDFLEDKSREYLVEMIEIIAEASCSTYPVQDESEAIQMFIFQNNRGKKPSNLEIIKSQFMYQIHLLGGDEKSNLLKEIKNRFEKIYKSIASIENVVDEDSVLLYTLRVYFDSLWEDNSLNKINEELSKPESINFIKQFTYSLTESFESLVRFYTIDEKENFAVHSLISLGGVGIAIPFILKAYKFNLEEDDVKELCKSLESLVLRHRLIGTRADIRSRLNDEYKRFSENFPSIQGILDRIKDMKTTQDWWFGYWNNSELEKSLQGEINHGVAKFLLWKYENHLESVGNNSGYLPPRFDTIENPELEHIAPVTKNEQPSAGYDNYDEEFINKYIHCIGNYLLISKSHNSSIGNKPFSNKLETYTHLKQQQEIQEMTKENKIWSRELIQKRKDKIISFLMDTL